MIYVDDYVVESSRRRLWKWAGHLFAVPTNEAELIDFAVLLGLRARYIQKRGTPNAHFDLSFRKRQEAIAAGAISVGWLEGARMRRAQLPADHNQNKLGLEPDDAGKTLVSYAMLGAMMRKFGGNGGRTE